MNIIELSPNNIIELSPKIVILTNIIETTWDNVPRNTRNSLLLKFFSDNTQDIISLPSHNKTSAMGDFVKHFQKLLFLKNIHIKILENYYDKQYQEPYIEYTSNKELEEILDVLEIMIITKSCWILEYLEYSHFGKKLSRKEFIELTC